MKELITGFILFGILIGVAMFFSGDVTPDLSSDGGYEQGGSIGHPLWTD